MISLVVRGGGTGARGEEAGMADDKKPFFGSGKPPRPFFRHGGDLSGGDEASFPSSSSSGSSVDHSTDRPDSPELLRGFRHKLRKDFFRQSSADEPQESISARIEIRKQGAKRVKTSRSFWEKREKKPVAKPGILTRLGIRKTAASVRDGFWKMHDHLEERMDRIRFGKKGRMLGTGRMNPFSKRNLRKIEKQAAQRQKEEALNPYDDPKFIRLIEIYEGVYGMDRNEFMQ